MEDFYRKKDIDRRLITITKDFHRLSVYRLTTPEKRNCRGCENLKIFCNIINVVVISLHSTGIAYRSSKIRWKLKYRYLIETVI